MKYFAIAALLLTLAGCSFPTFIIPASAAGERGMPAPVCAHCHQSHSGHCGHGGGSCCGR